MHASSAVRASLTVGSVETEYLRVGQGAPVLILDSALADAVERGLVPEAWRAHRVIVPTRTTIDALVMPTARSPFAAWLRGLVDGLGLHDLTIVVSPALLSEVRRFEAEHPDEVAQVIATDG